MEEFDNIEMFFFSRGVMALKLQRRRVYDNYKSSLKAQNFSCLAVSV